MRSTYILLHRHGHRAVSQALVQADAVAVQSTIQGESNQVNQLSPWFNLCLKQPHSSLHNLVNVLSHGSNPVPSDEAKFPFGTLSSLGANYMYQQGQGLLQEYPDLKDYLANNENAEIDILSTNYRRTQYSTQYLLAGLLGYDLQRNNSFVVIRSKKYQVNVSPSKDCYMALYDAYPDLARRLVLQTLNSAAYRNITEQSLLYQADIAQASQALISHFPKLGQGKYKGVDWPLAYDYFVCNRAHNLSIDSQIAAYEEISIRMFIFRYYSYYSDPEHLAYFMSPLLKKLKKVIQDACQDQSSSSSDSSKLSIFSGHDINIYGLLMAFQMIKEHPMHTYHSNTAPFTNEDIFWPSFGSVVLMKVSSDSVASSSGSRSEDVKIDLKYHHGSLLSISGKSAAVTESKNSVHDQSMTFTLAELEQMIKNMNTLMK